MNAYLPSLLDKQNTEDTRYEACWHLAFYLEIKGNKRERALGMLNHGIIHKLFDIGCVNLPAIQRPIIRVFGQLSALTPDIIELFYGDRLKRLMNFYLHSKNDIIINDTCFTIGNLIVTSEKIFKDFNQPEIINRIISLIEEHKKEQIKAEALELLQKFFNWGDKEVIESLIFEYKIIDLVFKSLETKIPSIVIKALKILESLLLFGEDRKENSINPIVKEVKSSHYKADVLEDLQRVDNKIVYDLINSILMTYFGDVLS